MRRYLALTISLALLGTGPALSGEHARTGHAAAAHHEAGSENGAARAPTGLAAAPARASGATDSGYVEGSNTDLTASLVKEGSAASAYKAPSKAISAVENLADHRQ